MSQIDETTGMTPTNNTVEEEYIPCPTIGCNDIGLYKLRIILINRWAYFCPKHKKELEECGLVSPEINCESSEVSH